MKALLGHQDEVVGFGLVGIEYMVEVEKSVSADILWQLAEELSKKANIIFISEYFYLKIRNLGVPLHAKMVMIPENKKDVKFKEVERLIKSTIGIDI